MAVSYLEAQLIGSSSSFDDMMDRVMKDTSLLEEQLEDVEEQNKDVVKSNKLLGMSYNQLGTAIAGVGASISAVSGGVIAKGLLEAGQFEQTNIAFGTLIGNAEETKETLADLTTFAAKTPFEMPEIETAARGLLTFGERGEELMETLEILGNAASGTAQDFGMIAEIFNQIRGVGKVTTQDFRQLSTRGVVFLQDIADHFSVTTKEAQELISTGKVGFEDLREILKGLSEEGGRFEAMMEKQSQSLLGLKSTLSDAFGLALRDIGQEFMPLAKSVTDVVIGWADAFREADPWIKQTTGVVVGLGVAVGGFTTVAGVAIIVAGNLASANATLTASYGGVTAASLAATKAVGASAAAAATATASFVAMNAAILGVTAVFAGAVWLAHSAQMDRIQAKVEGVRLEYELLESKLTDARSGIIDNLKEIEDATEREEKIEFHTKDSEARLNMLNQQLEQQKNLVEQTDWGILGNLDFGGGGQIVAEEAKQRITEIKDQIKMTKEHMKELKELEALDEKQFEEQTANLEDMNAALEHSIKFFGKTQEEIALIKAEQNGLNEELIESTRARYEELQAMEEAAKAAEEERRQREALEEKIQDTITKVQDEIAQLEMSEEAYRQFELQAQGFDDPTIERIMNLEKERDALEKVKEEQEKIKEFNEQYGDQTAKNLELQQQYARWADEGKISTEAFNKATADLWNTQEKYNNAARSALGMLDGFSESAVGLQAEIDKIREEKFGKEDGEDKPNVKEQMAFIRQDVQMAGATFSDLEASESIQSSTKAKTAESTSQSTVQAPKLEEMVQEIVTFIQTTFQQGSAPESPEVVDDIT